MTITTKANDKVKHNLHSLCSKCKRYNKVTWKILTKFLGLIVRIIIQFGEKGVLLREENLHVLHTDVDYPGSDVGAEGVNTLKKKDQTRIEIYSHTPT